MKNIGLVLPERDQYVLTTSEFLDVQERLIAYENRQPAEDEEESSRPSLRRRTPRPETDSRGEEVPDEDEPPKLERRDDDPDREPEEDERPVLRRRSPQ